MPERLHYKFADWGNPYDKLDGDTPFDNAVNALVSDYWVRTGHQMPLLDAMMAVLADDYNKRHETRQD